ncbi:MAG: hypothetical protein PHS41_02450 [Victivallaceae bacterium]|nr:hypothetical protein [Victivallaceae bacterium]
MKTLQEEIAEHSVRFDPQVGLIWKKWKGPGYHTRVPDGTHAHPTRDNIFYALGLLDSKMPEYRQRAFQVIDRVLSSQVVDLCNPAWGIWPWLDEEPVEKMNPPDWNWANFIGEALCRILQSHEQELPEELRRRTVAALERAAWSIFRRNVTPGYTNIAVIGSGVTGFAGEYFKNPLLLEYARTLLGKVLAQTLETGGLSEFNSPTYTFVALDGVEAILQVCNDARLREIAERLRGYIWEQLAVHFHPATGQLAGPHSRAYRDDLSAEAANRIADATGGAVMRKAPEPGNETNWEYTGINHLPCPKAQAERFARLTGGAQQIRQRYLKVEPEERSFWATTYLSEEVTLGTVNRECFWAQRRPILAYWVNRTQTPAMLKAAARCDGVDFCSLGVWTEQENAACLFSVGALTDRGAFHIHLDRNAEGSFSFRKLAVRLELAAPDAQLEVCECAGKRSVFVLSSGEYRAVVHPGDGRFRGREVVWESGMDQGRAYVEAVLWNTPELTTVIFDDKLECFVNGALEILPRSEEVEPSGVTMEGDCAVWRKFRLKLHRLGEPYN